MTNTIQISFILDEIKLEACNSEIDVIVKLLGDFDTHVVAIVKYFQKLN